MNTDFWGELIDPELASERIIDEAYDFEDYIEELNRNTARGIKPDFDSLFKPLDESIRNQEPFSFEIVRY